MLGVCERCNSQFKADSLKAVLAAFAEHKCQPIDTSTRVSIPLT